MQLSGQRSTLWRTKRSTFVHYVADTSSQRRSSFAFHERSARSHNRIAIFECDSTPIIANQSYSRGMIRHTRRRSYACDFARFRQCLSDLSRQPMKKHAMFVIRKANHSIHPSIRSAALFASLDELHGRFSIQIQLESIVDLNALRLGALSTARVPIIRR